MAMEHKWEKKNLDESYSEITKEELDSIYFNWFANFTDADSAEYQAALNAQTELNVGYTGPPEEMPIHSLWQTSLDKFTLDNNLRHTMTIV
jgi:hypothetical protein